jgi:hypothetical protein
VKGRGADALCKQAWAAQRRPRKRKLGKRKLGKRRPHKRRPHKRSAAALVAAHALAARMRRPQQPVSSYTRIRSRIYQHSKAANTSLHTFKE